MAFSYVHAIIFILVLPFCALAQNNGIVAVGSRISANETSRPWLSPSGDFAFGFKKLPDQDLFLLSIWFIKIPDRTTVWFVNSIDPLPRGSTVELNAQVGLLLRDPQGRSIWNPDAIADEIDHGFMNDTGNFVLVRSDNIRIWQSFEFPSDTILPSQELALGSVLFSRKSETNSTRGRFYLRFLDNGNLVLVTRSVASNLEDDDEYYNSLTSDSLNATNSGKRLIYDERGSLYILRGNNQRVSLSSRSPPPASENYFKATLNFNGVFTQYYHPRIFTGTPNWTPVWWAPDNICLDINGQIGSGACGYNTVCRLGNFGSPVCECPRGYKLIDPNDKYGSCAPNVTLSCGGTEQGRAEDLYDFLEIRDTDWPFSDSQRIWPTTQEICKQSCLEDCLCAVAIFRDNSCWKKKLPLSNGRIDTNLNAIAFLKFNKRDIPLLNPGSPDRENQEPNRGNGNLVIVGSVLLGSSVFINILLISAACCGLYLIYGKKQFKFYPSYDAVETNLRFFTYKELAEATNGFKEELGRGSFGIVYKGEIKMSSSKSIVAVKKLDRVAHDSEKEFRAEVKSIGQTHHKNLVRLIGFCDEGHNRLLVYEYMRNGTLSSFLFSDPRPSWSLRTQIAVGIARGLVYLHEECSNQIIHCDIKPQNILLDDYYNARISDFGLAKLLELNQSRTDTNIRGTKGYVAPEWFRNTQVNAKVDVYSFGVMLLEIITCRRSLESVESGETEGAIFLADWVWDCFQERRLDTLVGDDIEALDDRKKLERFVMVGIWCTQENSSLRPTMKRVSQMLEGAVEVILPPCPFLSSSINC